MTDEKTPRTDIVKFSEFTSVSGGDIEGVGLKNGQNVRFNLTTDAVQVNPNPFRNAKGQFIGTPEELEALKNQRDVNEFLYNAISDIEQGDIDLEGYATEVQLGEVDRTAIMRDDALKKEHDEDHTKQSVINAGVVVRLDELFWRDVEIDQLTRDGDKALQEEIDELALAVNTILLKHDSGKWKYIGDLNAGPPRNPGDLSIVGSLDSQTNSVTMHAVDLDGRTHVYADVDPGDYMELVNVNDPQQYILYVVTEIQDGAVNMLQADVNLKRKSGGDFAPDTELEVRYYQINEQDIALEDLDDRFVSVSGDTMTGELEVRSLVVKDVTPGTQAPLLVEGWVDGTNPAARITMSNKQFPNAYGSIEWRGNNGNGWFQFNKDVDLSSKNLHSVNHIRLSGDRTIQENQADRIRLDGKVVIVKAGSSNVQGFTVKGKTSVGNNGDLLKTFHNSSDLDAINYEGKMSAGSTNLATCAYVDERAGASVIPRFKLMDDDFENFKAGEFAMLDKNGDHTGDIDSTRCVVFSAVDIDGTRKARNLGAVRYSRTFNTSVSVLLDGGDKTVLSMSPLQNSPTICQIDYVPEYEGTELDLYIVYWAGLKSHVVTSDVSAWNVGATYQLYIPEIFY